MNKKQWYQVHLSTEKLVLIFAEDELEAMDKAEEKLNKKRNEWIANTARLANKI